jgi:acetyl-CoA C-acetyltransferase
MAFLEDIAIVSAVRTPIGKFQGSLSDFSAPQLGAIVVREAVKRAGIDPNTIDECIMGNVVSAGLGQNAARQAAVGGGLADSVSAVTINKVCGSGLKAVALGQQAIQTGIVRTDLHVTHRKAKPFNSHGNAPDDQTHKRFQ